MGRASPEAASCTQDHGPGPGGQPQLACPSLLARLLFSSLVQDIAQGSKSSLPGSTAAPCPGLWARVAVPAVPPCHPCALGSWGLAVPHACPTAAGGAQCPLLPALSTLSAPSRTPCTSTAQTLARLACRIKSTQENEAQPHSSQPRSWDCVPSDALSATRWHDCAVPQGSSMHSGDF